MGYLKSNEIKCYPTAFRDHSKDPESYLNTEKNLTDAKVLSRAFPSYVEVKKDENEIITDLHIYIKGYHFYIVPTIVNNIVTQSVNDIVLSLEKPLYACIKTGEQSSSSGGTTIYQNLRLKNYDTGDFGILDLKDSNDDNYRFYGIYFTNNPNDDKLNETAIQIFDGDGNVPESSKLKLLASEIGIDTDKSIETKFTTKELIIGNVTSGTADKVKIIGVDNSGSVQTYKPGVEENSSSDNTNKVVWNLEMDDYGKVTYSTKTLDVVSTSRPGLVPQASSVSSQTQSTKFLREDGTWATPSYTIDTNTATASDNILKGSNSGTQITYAPYSSDNKAAGRLYSGTTNPTNNTRLNYDGNFHAHDVYDGQGTKLTGNTGTVTSITIKTEGGLSGGSNTASTTIGTWTIGIGSEYKLPTTSEWDGKQNALVSGTSIKTINSNSLLGSGNIGLYATNLRMSSDTEAPTISEQMSSLYFALNGKVPTTRKVNNKPLSSDITLTASDVSALPSSTTIPATNVIPSQTTANKLLLSTSTGGTAAWSSWNSSGFLKTNTSGVVSVDTNSYATTSSLGTQVTYDYQSGVLTITTK